MLDTTLILPTYNESLNISSLLPAVKTLGCYVIIVDDNSPDNTAEVAREFEDDFTRVVVRKNERGLGSAIRYGASLASTPWVAVMDTDGQHLPDDMRRILEVHQSIPSCELIIGSRYVDNGSSEGLSLYRRLGSRALNCIAGVRAKTKVSDYLTGMFLTRREIITNTKETGFKILFDILKHNKLNTIEVPITLAERLHGKSKMSTREVYLFFKGVLT